MSDTITAAEIKERYEALDKFRSLYLNRAYEYAKVTLPYLITQTEDNSSTEMQVDYSDIGAEYTNHLANKYINELFPSTRSFFKLQLNKEELQKQSQATGTMLSKIEEALVAGEKRARWEFEQKGARSSLLDAMKQLIVTGNCLVYYPPDKEKEVQTYALDEFVILRSPSGEVLEIVTEDKKSVLALDPEYRDEVIASMDLSDDADLSTTTASLYTYIKVDPDNPKNYLVYQAVEETMVQEETSYPIALSPWIPLVWNRTRREIYGRGLVEEHYGAFYALNVLTEAIVTGGAVMTDFKWLVKPGSILDIVEMNNSASGTYHYGMPDDVQAIEAGKVNDFKFIFDLIQWYSKNLGKTFMVFQSQIRDSERTTATENRMVAQELETAHGGVFSNFAKTFQKPIAGLLLRDIEIDLSGTDIEPVIVTGIDAMGRGADNDKVLYFFNDLAQTQNVPPEFLARFRPAELMTFLASGRDVDSSTWIKSEDEVKQDMAEAQGQQQDMVLEQEQAKQQGQEEPVI